MDARAPGEAGRAAHRARRVPDEGPPRRGHLRRQGGEPAQPGALLLHPHRRHARLRPAARPIARRHRDGASSTTRRRRCSSRTSSSRSTSRASTSSSRTTRSSSACGWTASSLPAAGGGAAVSSGTARATSAPTRAPAPSARRCASSTATSSCAPAPTTCCQPQAALPAVPDRPLPGAVRLPRRRPRTTAAAWTRWCCSWRARRGELVEALRARMKARRGRAEVRGGRAPARSAHRASSAAWSARRWPPPSSSRPGRLRLLPRGRPPAVLRPLRAAGPAQRRPGLPLRRPGVPRRGAAAVLRQPLLRPRATSCPRRCCCRSSPETAWRRWRSCSPSARASGCACSCPSAARSTTWCAWPARTPSRPSSSASAPRTRRTAVLARLQQTGCT